MQLTMRALRHGIIVAAAALSLAACGTRWGKVSGSSMEPTLHDGQRVLIGMPGRELRRGDIVAFHPPTYPDRTFVQRIAGLPGEEIDVQSGTDRLRVRVPAGHYYLLGDNRGNSYDSRSFGPVPRSAVWGTVIWH